jgi:nitrogen regulatory protein P-II 1
MADYSWHEICIIECMKKIEAIIQRERYEEVRSALETVGYPGMMVTEIEGHGTQRGVQILGGREYKIGLIKKLKLEIGCLDHRVPEIMNAIALAARTGKTGDGKIFVYPVEEAMRIRTGETGEDALEVPEGMLSSVE